MISTVISVVVVLGILGLLVYLLETYVPMPQPFRIVNSGSGGDRAVAVARAVGASLELRLSDFPY